MKNKGLQQTHQQLYLFLCLGSCLCLLSPLYAATSGYTSDPGYNQRRYETQGNGLRGPAGFRQVAFQEERMNKEIFDRLQQVGSKNGKRGKLLKKSQVANRSVKTILLHRPVKVPNGIISRNPYLRGRWREEHKEQERKIKERKKREQKRRESEAKEREAQERKQRELHKEISLYYLLKDLNVRAGKLRGDKGYDSWESAKRAGWTGELLREVDMALSIKANAFQHIPALNNFFGVENWEKADQTFHAHQQSLGDQEVAMDQLLAEVGRSTNELASPRQVTKLSVRRKAAAYIKAVEEEKKQITKELIEQVKNYLRYAMADSHTALGTLALSSEVIPQKLKEVNASLKTIQQEQTRANTKLTEVEQEFTRLESLHQAHRQETQKSKQEFTRLESLHQAHRRDYQKSKKRLAALEENIKRWQHWQVGAVILGALFSLVSYLYKKLYRRKGNTPVESEPTSLFWGT